MRVILYIYKYYLRPPPPREPPPPPREPPLPPREPPPEKLEPRDWLPTVERVLLLWVLLLRDTDERLSVDERLYDERSFLLLLLFVLVSCCCVVFRLSRFTLVVLFSCTALLTLVVVLLFARSILPLLRARSFVTPLRVTLLRVLLGRSYTR